MLPVEHNGDGFHYVVSYTRRDPYHPAGTHLAVERRVWDWRQGQLVVNELEEYSSEPKLLARWQQRVWNWRQGQLVVNELEEYSEYLVSESKLLARWQQRVWDWQQGQLVVNELEEYSSEPKLLARWQQRVWDWRQGQLVVNELEEYSEYVVAVRAANSVGPAPRSTVEQRIGHSSENGTLLYIG